MSYSQSTDWSQSSMPALKRYRRSSKLRHSSRYSRRGYSSFSLYSRPRRVTPYSKIYTMERSCSFLTPMNLSTGFNAGGQFLGLSFCLEGCQWYTGTTYQGLASISNVTEFQSLFDKWRIDKIEVIPVFSNSQSSVNSPATVLPVIYQALDFDSVTGTNNLSEYPQMRTIQLGTVNNGLTKCYLTTPTVTDAVSNNNAGTITGVLAGTRISPWLDTASPDISHFGMRFQFQNFGRTSSTDIGTILWQIKIYYSFKTVR